MHSLLPPDPEKVRDAQPQILRYFIQADVHVSALATSAGLLLFSYPFILAVLVLCERQLGWTQGARLISVAIDTYFVGDLYDFTRRTVAARRSFSLSSTVLPLVTSVAIFYSLRSALNRAEPEPAGFFLKDVWKPILVFPCAGLFLASAILTPIDRDFVHVWVSNSASIRIEPWTWLLILKLAALGLSTCACFVIFWLWPVRRTDAAQALWMAMLAGFGLESLKYAWYLLWRPLWEARIHRQYGPFYDSATVLVFAYCAVLVVLAVSVLGHRWSRAGSTSGPELSV